MNTHSRQHGSRMKNGYWSLSLALTLSLAVMFPLTMAFVNRWSDFYLNLSNFYMAVLMVAPMGLIMLFVMRSMFPDKRLNIVLMVGFVAMFFLALWLGRSQAFVNDDRFLRAMIPHHSRAILVCEEASISDPEIEALCDQIIASQQAEIDIMKRIRDER